MWSKHASCTLARHVQGASPCVHVHVRIAWAVGSMQVATVVDWQRRVEGVASAPALRRECVHGCAHARARVAACVSGACTLMCYAPLHGPYEPGRASCTMHYANHAQPRIHLVIPLYQLGCLRLRAGVRGRKGREKAQRHQQQGIPHNGKGADGRAASTPFHLARPPPHAEAAEALQSDSTDAASFSVLLRPPSPFRSPASPFAPRPPALPALPAACAAPARPVHRPRPPCRSPQLMRHRRGSVTACWPQCAGTGPTPACPRKHACAACLTCGTVCAANITACP